MANYQPLVSVVINNYNYQHFLVRCINSALSQTYAKTEVIVVDDGSTDNSREVIERYRGRIVPVYKSNGGQASALNRGFEYARGDFLVFLDSDDELLPSALERVAEVFGQNENISHVIFRLQVVDAENRPTGALLPSSRLQLASGNIQKQLIRNRSYTHPPTSGHVFRKSAITEIMPIPELVFRKGAAAYLVYTVDIVGELRSIDEPLGLYRIHNTNVSEINQFLDGDRLSAHLQEDACVRSKQIAMFRKHYGITMSELAFGDLTHIKQHVILKKLYPQKYTFSRSIFQLCLRGLIAAVLANNIRLLDRPIWMLWFLGMLIAPRTIAQTMVIQLSQPNRRASLTKIILGNRHRSN
jgi:glycosyltransferase involved in cell wall biosynthesis